MFTLSLHLNHYHRVCHYTSPAAFQNSFLLSAALQFRAGLVLLGQYNERLTVILWSNQSYELKIQIWICTACNSHLSATDKVIELKSAFYVEMCYCHLRHYPSLSHTPNRTTALPISILQLRFWHTCLPTPQPQNPPNILHPYASTMYLYTLPQPKHTCLSYTPALQHPPYSLTNTTQFTTSTCRPILPIL